MNKISITDITLRRATENGTLGFKEKLEIAKCLDRVNISAIELAPLTDSKADSIFVKTLASVIRNTTLALPAGETPESADRAWEALRSAARARLIVDVPVSNVQMEYIARKKPEKCWRKLKARFAAALRCALTWNSAPLTQVGRIRIS